MRFYPSLFAITFILSTAYAQQPSKDSPPPPSTSKELPAANQDHTIHVNRFVLATGVQNKEPQGEKTSFDGGDHAVFAFLDLKSTENKTITLCWKRNGHNYHVQKLTVKASPRFRTWAHVKALSGNWTVTIEDEQGKTVQELSFVVSGSTSRHGIRAAHPEEAVQKNGIKDVLTSLEPEKTSSK